MINEGNVRMNELQVVSGRAREWRPLTQRRRPPAKPETSKKGRNILGPKR